jgi:hypothetical protein
METFGNILETKSSHNKYFCETCYYTCSKHCNFEKHLRTKKHNQKTKNVQYITLCCNENKYLENIKHDKNKKVDKMPIKVAKKVANEDKKVAKVANQICCEKCNKQYKTRSGLWKHKQECTAYKMMEIDTLKKELEFKNEMILKAKEDMLMLCVNQNKEFQCFMLEQMKIIQEKQLLEQNTTNNTIAMNNCNNKTFNLQFFLNETCKDAMNLSDFVNNIKIEVDDLIDSPIGYVKCITSQFMKFYKQLPVEKRPFHCSDEKRRSLHVKENGEWAIDECEAKIRKAVKSISHKNICRLVSWKKIHLDYSDPESVTNTQYISIIQNCCAGKDDLEIEKNEMKVVFNLIKESVIDKKRYIH